MLIIIIYILIYLNLPKLLIKNINFLKKKHLEPTVCICTLGKSENRYIREFIKYYENFGIDKIFLYDNNDKDGERFEEVIIDYINKGFVVLLNWRGKKRSIFKIMNDCYLRNYKIYSWLVFYEIDEYLYIKNYSNIKTFLSESKFNHCKIIYLNWVFHTDNNLIQYDNRTLRERFPFKEPRVRNNSKSFNNPVKSILRGNISNININHVHLLNSKIKGCNGFGQTPIFQNYYYMKNADYRYYYIDHYYSKSVEEFTEKINKGCAFSGGDIKYKLFRIKRYFSINLISYYRQKKHKKI